MSIRTLAVPVLLVAALGCNSAKQDSASVRQGIVEHVTKNAGLDMSSMDLDMNKVQFQGNQATATVSFRPKNSPANEVMQMTYDLESKDGKWVVKGKPRGLATSHGAGSGMPSPAVPPSGQLPPGHPPLESQK